jgi:hypothetical protein
LLFGIVEDCKVGAILVMDLFVGSSVCSGVDTIVVSRVGFSVGTFVAGKAFRVGADDTDCKTSLRVGPRVHSVPTGARRGSNDDGIFVSGIPDGSVNIGRSAGLSI